MKAKDKPKYVKEARDLYSLLDIENLAKDPNDLESLSKINRLIAIFKDFSSNDGQELKRLLLEYQKWGRRSSSKGTFRNRAVDMLQFIGQKIEEMDIYVIEDIEEKKKRIVEELKNENLWARATIEDKDLHVIVGERENKKGEHAHFIVDSKTGEIRVDPGDKSPHDFIEKVVSVTTKGGKTAKVVQQGTKATIEFLDTTMTDNIPILYTTNKIGKTGGPKGHFTYFTIKNIGKEIALDIRWGIRGFPYNYKGKTQPFELEPGQSKEVEYSISEEKPFREHIPDLNIVMEYKDVKGRNYFTRRDLKQVKVPSGDFYNLETSIFHSPSIIVDDGLRLISGPNPVGDRYEIEFEIKTSSGVERAKIGVSKTFLSAWGFSVAETIEQALVELGHRQMRKMAREGRVQDFIFVTTDYSQEYQSDLSGYLKLREAI